MAAQERTIERLRGAQNGSPGEGKVKRTTKQKVSG